MSLASFNTLATRVLATSAVVVGLGAAAIAFDKALGRFDGILIDNQEGMGFVEVMPQQFRGRIVHENDCTLNADGSYAVFSGGLPVPNTTAIFNENRLPLAVPVATGYCGVTVTNKHGDVIDSYKVNAYNDRQLIVYNLTN
jgi:hypothetical protein